MTPDQIQNHILSILETTRFGKNDSDAHLLPLFSMALASKGKTYVELGVRNGITTLPLLLAAHLNGGILYSVDIPETKFICPPELAQNWKFIKSDALHFLKNWDATKHIDIAYIDDLHTYHHVKQELYHIDKFTSPSSVIFLHDLMYGGYEPSYHTNPAMWKGEWAFGGPYRAVRSLNSRTWEWATLPWFSGLTILRKKAPIFSESKIKIWAKRVLKYLSPKTERDIVAKYQDLKKR